MSLNEDLYDNALKAITELFNDNTVTKQDAVSNLEYLIGEIKIMIDSLEEGS